MRTPSILPALIALSVVTLAACGGSTPPAEEPSASSAAEKSDDAKADDKKDEAKSDDDKAGDKSDSKSPDNSTSGPAVTRTPKDMLTAPEVTFMFSFNQSEPKEKAEEKCTGQSKGDAKKMAECMKKASAKFEADGMQFKKNDRGDWVWITLRRKGSTLTALHKIPFEFGTEKATSIILKPTGKDTGKQPMRSVPSEVTIEVPNEFQIVMKDPDHGRMVYEAKIGITSDDKAK